jgi:hypothetical protein
MREHSPARGRKVHSGGPNDLAVKLLGGAERRPARLRGFVPWQPKEGTKAILAQINEGLGPHYRSHTGRDYLRDGKV